jgi:hypothetical protein
MATTTPNYGWPVPTSTDFVKDGATAIEALGDAIDATVFGLPAGGLTLINTTTFSAVASQSVNDVFSATYDNYRIVCEFSSSTDQELFFRLRASGSDLTTSVYQVGEIFLGVGISTPLSSNNNTSRTSCRIANNGSSFSAGFVVDVIAPNKAQAKFFNSQSSGRVAYFNVAQIQEATAYTGFTIFSTAATTMTGSLSVYGYAK